MKLVYNDAVHGYWLDGKRCTSVTTVAKIPEKTFSLDKWRERKVAMGLALRPDLVERAAAHFDEVEQLEQIFDEAAGAGGAYDKARMGTAAHRITERHDAAEDIIETAWSRKVRDAWQQAMEDAGLEVACDSQGRPLQERVVVWPEQLVCGKFDRICRRADGSLVVVDLKTGDGAIKYPHSIAIQLALYAYAPLIAGPLPVGGGSTEEFEPSSGNYPIDESVGLVVHMPDEGPVQVYEFDIDAGHHAAFKVCFGAMAWRKQASLCWPLGARSEDGSETEEAQQRAMAGGGEGERVRPAADAVRNDRGDREPGPSVPPSEGCAPADATGLDPAALLAAIEALPPDVYNTLKQLATERQLPAPRRLAAATPEQLAAVAAAVQQAKDACLYATPAETAERIEEGRRELIERSRRSNDARDDQPVAGAKMAVSDGTSGLGDEQRHVGPALPPSSLEEGPPADPAAIDALTRHLAKLTAPQQNIIKDWLAQARAAGVFFGNLKQNPTVRRFSLARACWALVAHMDGDDELVRLALAFVAGDDEVQPAFPTGAIIGALSVEQADRLHEVATGIGERYILGAGRLEEVA